MIRRQLLLDSRIIDSVKGASLTLGTVEKHPANPLFAEDRPWERRFDNLYANVLYDDDEGLYKCWYSPFIVSWSSRGMTLAERRAKSYGKHPQEMGICYATSDDGLRWQKPDLGLVEYDGSKSNNILWRGGRPEALYGPHGAGIFKDLEDPDSERRYKAILKDQVLSVAFSADGIHWGPAIACPAANSAGDTHNNACWAPTLEKYVAITRQWRKDGNDYIRLVARTESDDFLNWAKTRVVLEGEDRNQQIYTMPVFFHGGIYLGLIAVHDQEQDRVWTELSWSTDTVNWNRVQPGTPLIANDGEYGDYDWGCVYAAATPVFLDDEIRIYYGASDGLHTSWRNGYLALATLRPDGFAGYQATAAHGDAVLTTVPLFGGNSTLQVSADIADGGEVVVLAIAEDRSVLAESMPLTATVSDAKIRWRDPSAPTSIAADSARLQFRFKNATVFSFALA